MPARGRVTRSLLWGGLIAAGLVAAAGGIVLRASGLIAVVIAGAVVGCLAFGVARESEGTARRSPFELAWQAGAATIGLLLVITGLVVLAGGVTAALVCGLAAIGGVTVWLLHLRRASARRAGRAARPQHAAPDDAGPVGLGLMHGLAGPTTVAAGSARVLPPVSALPTAELGREWLRTTALLAGRLGSGVLGSVARRRRETLDELERRDPAGFARWMAGGPAPGSDPAAYVHGEPPAHGNRAA